MKVTIACLLVSLCMDVCLSQSRSSTASITSEIPNITTTKNTSSIIIPSTANISITTPANGSISTNPTSVSTITSPASRSTITTHASGSTVTTTSASRGFNTACMTPFLAVLSVVGFLLL